MIQSAFLWGYMATQLFGGTMADKYGGKRVMAFGIAWFSVASLLMPLALSAPVVAAGMTLPALLAARCMVVGAWPEVHVGVQLAPLYAPPTEQPAPHYALRAWQSVPLPTPHRAPPCRAWARGWLCPR